jgi:hypothetical protein
MLDAEVAEAVASGRFHLWAARTVDEGIALLTGLAAGARDGDEIYPPDTLHERVRRRLGTLAAQARRAAGTYVISPPDAGETPG